MSLRLFVVVFWRPAFSVYIFLGVVLALPLAGFWVLDIQTVYRKYPRALKLRVAIGKTV